jgi:hypothetical protein
MYYFATNHAVAIFSGGNTFVEPIKWTELIFNSAVNMAAFVYTAIITALITNLFNTVASSRRDFQEQDIVLQEFFFVHRVPKALRLRVTRFLYHKFVERRFMAANEMVKDLPESLRYEVLVSIRAGYLEEGHEFFRGLTKDGLDYICARSIDTFYMDNDTIIKQGMRADCALFMTQGMAVVLLADGKSVVKKAPCSLGERSLFSDRISRDATVMAMKPSAAIIVSREAVEGCIELYPINLDYYLVFCELVAAETGTEARTREDLAPMY